MNEFFSEINRGLDRFLTPAVKVILILNVLSLFFFIILGTLNPGATANLINFFGQMPARSVFRFYIWQFLTFNFIHADFNHLLLNMLGLVFFAPALESRWGTKKFWHFYLSAGIGAGIFHALLSIALNQTGALIVGASGAIYGVFLAFATYFPEQPVYLFGVYPIKANYLLAVMIFLTFLASAGGSSGSNISHVTHLGGLVAAYIWLSINHRSWDFRRWRWTRY